MRLLKRSMLKFLATTLSIVILLTSFTVATAEAGLFQKIKDTVKQNPGKTALATIAVGAGAIIAAPYIATAIGAAAGTTVAAGAGAAVAVAGAGAGIAGIGTAIWGGVCAAGGFFTGALGAVGGAIGGLFSGIAGFVGGIIGSPLFIPALVVIGVAVAGYFLWKKYHRQNQTIGNGNELPMVGPSVGAPTGEVAVVADQGQTTGGPGTSVIPVANNGEIPVTGDQGAVLLNTTPAVSGSADALKTAHSDYIKAYNKYISLVTNIGGSESPNEEINSNMNRNDVQTALQSYRDAYNTYITLLRESNAK